MRSVSVVNNRNSSHNQLRSRWSFSTSYWTPRSCGAWKNLRDWLAPPWSSILSYRRVLGCFRREISSRCRDEGSMQSEKKEIISAIDQAFGALSYPGDMNIVAETAGIDLECLDVRTKLLGQHWKDVPFEELLDLKAALPCLSPAGFRF